MSPDSVDDLLVSLASRGLRLANLFQLDWGSAPIWQANVTDGEKVWEYGRGPNAAAALRAAMFVAATEPGEAYPPGAARAKTSALIAPVSPEELGL